MNITDFSYNQPIQSMYLSTLEYQNKKRPQTATRNNLKVDDIQGTRPKFLQRPIKPRETFNNRNDDISKSTPKILIAKQINKPSFNMSIDDIQGTRSKLNKFTSSRCTNPLNPQYQIPKVQYYPVEQPKFIRDNMVTYDIQGTSTKQSFAMKLEKQGKVQNSKQQVLKAIQLKKKCRLRTTQNLNFLDVTDINLKQGLLKGNRSTNPLDPQYQLPKKQQKGAYRYGEIQKSKPPESKTKFNNPDFSLTTVDIPGAKSKKNNFVIGPKQQIKQSKVDSFKRGIQSDRKTNPLNPNYKYPGWSQNSNNQSSSYQRPKTAHQKFDAFIGK